MMDAVRSSAHPSIGLRGSVHPGFRYAPSGLRLITKPLRQFAKSFCTPATRFGKDAKSSCIIAKSFGNYAQPLFNLAKSFGKQAQPLCKDAKPSGKPAQ
ncbi:MAG: hypothetical protein PHE55_01975 [Methylococcaceae bacterium]|nr:hypothetical protein [Methylococcaceae bacterium]